MKAYTLFISITVALGCLLSIDLAYNEFLSINKKTNYEGY